MSCKCKSNCKPCGSTKGERGLQGLTGAQGEPGPAGPAGGGIVNKISVYTEFIGQVQVGDTGIIYHHPPGYEVLSWTNTTGAAIILHVMGTYNIRLQNNNTNSGNNEVDGAIVQTIGGSDTILWESLGRFSLDPKSIIHVFYS